MQKEVAYQEETRRFENEYERTRREALERIKQAEEKRKDEERRRGEELRKQMEELKLREEEVFRASANNFFCAKPPLQTFFFVNKIIFYFSLTGHSSEKGARGSTVAAVGAGEDRGGQEEGGGTEEEV